MSTGRQWCADDSLLLWKSVSYLVSLDVNVVLGSMCQRRGHGNPVRGRACAERFRMVEKRSEDGGHVAFAVEKAKGNSRNIRA